MAEDIASLRKSLEIYKGLVEVSGLINSITDYDELLRAVLEVARRVVQAEAASLFLRTEGNNHLDLIIATSGESEFVQPKIRVEQGQGIAGWVLEHGKSQLIPDAYADPRFFRDVDKNTGFHTRSILCSPLKWNGVVIGVLQVLNPRGKKTFEQEDLEGFDAYSNLIATAIEKLRTLERIRQQELVEREVTIAAEIQHELLAHAVPAQIPGVTFASYNKAASNVGGDFFFVFPRSHCETYFAIGDVSGKGIPASLLMAQILSAMQFVFSATTSPSSALSTLNTTLHDHIVRGMFATTLVGRMIHASRRIEFSSAGHCRPWLVDAQGESTEISTEGALPLGLISGVSYHQGGVDLGPGDFLVCYTDGLSESRNPVNGAFFEDQLKTTLTRKFRSAQEIVDHLVSSEEQFRHNTAAQDDLTLLVGGFQ